MKNKSMIRLIGFLFGLPILIFSIFNFVRAKSAMSWPQVQGIVQKSNPVGLGESKTLELEVGYSVQGVALICDRIEFGGVKRPRDKYRYRLGAEALVFYDPTDPTVCVLEPDVSGAIIAHFVIGLALSAIGLFAHTRLKSQKEDTSQDLF